VAPRGRFITLEGGEAAGKSTQARQLAEELRARGLDVLVTREPGGAPGSEILRGLLLGGEVAWSSFAEVLLHFAARAEHVAKTIAPALAAGRWVVCDRFFDSTMVYQGFALGADREKIGRLTDMMETRPDLTIVLDVPVSVSVARLAGRGGVADRYERRGAAFFERVRDGFLAVAAADPARFVVLGADRPEADVGANIIEVVRVRLPLPERGDVA
jgi:dTMP kinase